ncbi:MAG: glycosyltransferase [Syntrophomonadaceae bacterium]|nr:glycosyltransferase [Syntrophomonadaceae bacterium]
MGTWRGQLVKFGVVGILNTWIDYGLFNVLITVTGVHDGPGVGLFNLLGITLAATNSYFWNRNWTFAAGDEEYSWQTKRFVVATGLGMIINSLVVTAASRMINWLPVSAYLILNGSKLLGAAISSAWNFITYRQWVFKPVPPVLVPSKEQWVPGLVSVIIPAYNEMERLPKRLYRLALSLPRYFPVEIVVVDDGSTDQTLAAVQAVAAQFPHVRCSGYRVNSGKGLAVRTGICAARGEFLIFTDADETFTEEHIVAVAERLFEGDKVVIGQRQASPGTRLLQESRWRHFCGRAFNLLVQALVLPGINDTQCGLKGFHREAAGEIFGRQRLRGFAFDVELLALARALHFDIVQVPVRAVHCKGSRVNRILTPVQMVWDVLRIKAALVVNTYGLPGGGQWFREALVSIVLFFTALAIRIPYLWSIPRYIDELKEVQLAYLICQGKVFPLHNMAHDIGALHNYILAVLFRLLGPSIYWPRLYVAVTSALTVALVYRLGTMLYGRWVGLVAAGLLMTNGMHIVVTHMAWANSTTPFFFTLALMATIAAEQQKSGQRLMVAALLWAATLQTHSSVIIYLLVAVAYVLRPHFRRETGIGLKWYVLAALTFLTGYANMVYYNIVSYGGSIRWIGHKSYALETHPGLTSYIRNLEQMLTELVRSVGSTYTDHPHFWDYVKHPSFIAAVSFF